jgi:GAF domain-containing protein
VSETYRAAVEVHSPLTARSTNAEPIVATDITNDARLAPYPTTIRAERIAAMAFIPLERPAGVIGKFMLYYDASQNLSTEEIDLPMLIAARVAFAVARTQAHLTATENAERRNLRSTPRTWAPGIGRSRCSGPTTLVIELAPAEDGSRAEE